MSHLLLFIPEVREFVEEISRSGTWNGKALEGFVVHTTIRTPPTDGKAGTDMSPYPPGSSFFFKFKFDKPYMMYRNWHEIAKLLLLRGKGAKFLKNEMKLPEIKIHVKWVQREIQNHPKLFEGYSKGHGIISTCEQSLEWLETEEGKKGKKQVEADEEVKRTSDKTYGKTIIIPIAVPGPFYLYSSKNSDMPYKVVAH